MKQRYALITASAFIFAFQSTHAVQLNLFKKIKESRQASKISNAHQTSRSLDYLDTFRQDHEKIFLKTNPDNGNNFFHDLVLSADSKTIKQFFHDASMAGLEVSSYLFMPNKEQKTPVNLAFDAGKWETLKVLLAHSKNTIIGSK